MEAYKKGWSLCERDSFLEYRLESSKDRYDYMAYMSTKDHSHSYEGILVVFYPDPQHDTNSEVKVRINLTKEFKDYLHPTEEEVILFEMERELPYIPEEVLKQMRNGG